MKKTMSTLVIIIALLFIYAPILLLSVYSFTDAKTIGVWNGFSLDLYKQLFTEPKLSTMLIDTFILAILASVISTILGVIGAIGIFYNKKILGKLTRSASQIPVINAEIVTAISLTLVFAFVGLGKSYTALLIGHVVLCTPFVVLSILPKLKQIDPNLYEAALDLGATPFQALIKIILPQILPGVFSGFMLAITLSLDDYMITAYSKPAEFETLSTYVFGALKKPRNSYLPALRAFSTILFVVMIIATLVMNYRVTREDRKNKKLKPKGEKKLKKIFPKITSICLCLALTVPMLTLTACGDDGNTLKVYNCYDYIDNSLISEFETYYKQKTGNSIKVKYEMFDTPEDAYNNLKIYPDNYDLVCPSDYMIEKMAREGMLQEIVLGADSEYNQNVSPYIKQTFESIQFDGKNLSSYAAGYMWGTLGICYNPAKVDKADMSSWGTLWGNTYKNKFTVKDSIRDTYFISLSEVYRTELETLKSNANRKQELNRIFNDTTTETIAKAETAITKLINNSFGIEVDEGKDEIIQGNTDIYVAWSGDAVYAMDEAETAGLTLNYSVPEEGSNVWFDGWVIPKASKKADVATEFINFISKPENVIKNMEYTGYVSCIAGADVFAWVTETYGDETGANQVSLDYFFKNSDDTQSYQVTFADSDRQFSAQYPSQSVIDRCVIMNYYPDEQNKAITNMWMNVKNSVG